ncbi:MAG: membrane protein insertion efficiency factor YidD [candidate division WOR-3 bacterium]|jgi:putative membrane protein insertion efficiency factor
MLNKINSSLPSAGRKVAIALVRLYQLTLGTILPNSCRFYPTCSEYALEAIGRYGILTGLWLALKRLCRCHPLHPGGYDPVPERTEKQ